MRDAGRLEPWNGTQDALFFMTAMCTVQKLTEFHKELIRTPIMRKGPWQPAEKAFHCVWCRVNMPRSTERAAVLHSGGAEHNGTKHPHLWHQ